MFLIFQLVFQFVSTVGVRVNIMVFAVTPIMVAIRIPLLQECSPKWTQNVSSEMVDHVFQCGPKGSPNGPPNGPRNCPRKTPKVSQKVPQKVPQKVCPDVRSMASKMKRFPS